MYLCVFASGSGFCSLNVVRSVFEIHCCWCVCRSFVCPTIVLFACGEEYQVAIAEASAHVTPDSKMTCTILLYVIPLTPSLHICCCWCCCSYTIRLFILLYELPLDLRIIDYIVIKHTHITRTSSGPQSTSIVVSFSDPSLPFLLTQCSPYCWKSI